MINHYKQIEDVEYTYNQLTKEYKKFYKDNNVENRNNLKRKIKDHRDAITRLVATLDNMYIGGPDK